MEVKAGYKHTEVSAIPGDWEIKTLSEIAEVKSGGTPSTKKKEYWDGNVFWCIPTDITSLNGSKYLFDTERKITELGLKNSSAEILPKDSIVMTSRATIGECAISKVPISTNQGFKSLVPKRVDVEFLYYKVLTLKSKLVQLGSGSTFFEISKKDIERLTLSIPSTIAEQSAIATALSDADALIDSLEKLTTKKRDIKQGTIQQLLTGKRRLPGFSGEWVTKKLGDIFQFLSTANNPHSDLTEYGNVKYIHYGYIHTRPSSFLDCEKEGLPFIDARKVRNIPFLEDGDLLMVDASEDYVGLGKSIEVRNAGKNVVAGLHTLLLRSDKDTLSDGFKGYLQFIPEFRQSLVRIATGISVYGISKNNLKGIEVHLPDIKEQSAIAQVLSDMDAEIEELEHKLAKYKMIKQGMMQELLTGKTRLI